MKGVSIVKQDVQQSPLALLAQTCSKIGSEEGSGQGNSQAVRVVNTGQGEVIAPSWVQIQTVVDPSKQGQVQAIPQGAISFPSGQV